MAMMVAVVLTAAALTACGRGDDRVKAKEESETERLWREGKYDLNTANFRNAAEKGNRLLEIAEEDDDTKAEIFGKIILGQAEIFSDSAQNAYTMLRDAELLCLHEKNDSCLASVYNGLGIYSDNVENDLQEALRYFFKGLETARRAGNERMHSLLLVNISAVYSLLNDPSGIRYAMECYRHGKEKGERFLIYAGASSAASIYAENGTDTDHALDLLREAELIHHDDDMNNHASLYYIYGRLLMQKGDTTGAAECFEESMAHIYEDESDGDLRGFIGMSEILMDRGESRQAIAMLDSALAISGRIPVTLFRLNVLNALSSTHRKLGNRQLQAKYEAMAAAEREAKSKTSPEVVNLVKSKYDLERAENEVNRLKIEKLEKEMTVRTLIVVIVIVLLVFSMMLGYHRRKQRLYAAIVRQSTESAREEERLRDIIRDLESKAGLQPAPESKAGFQHDPSAGSDSHSKAGFQPAPSSPATSSESLNRLAAEFESLMSDPKVFCDPQMSKDKIAELLHTNRTYVSKIVNDKYKMNLPHFINQLRIKEAIRRLSDPECDIPLKQLASELGYSSITTFYSKFNEATGMPPAAFRDRARQI